MGIPYAPEADELRKSLNLPFGNGEKGWCVAVKKCYLLKVNRFDVLDLLKTENLRFGDSTNENGCAIMCVRLRKLNFMVASLRIVSSVFSRRMAAWYKGATPSSVGG